MKKTLILVAGPPATGKSYLINQIQGAISDFFFISPDEIKELYAEKYGFNNLDEKNQLEILAWKFYYNILEKYSWLGKKVIITEYPFSNKQEMKFQKLTSKYNYQIITIRLICDFDVLWERRKKRDLGCSRHLSHIMSHYHFGDILQDRASADNLITKEGFREKILQSKYNFFSMGTLFEVDVTDFNKIDYKKLLHDVAQLIA